MGAVPTPTRLRAGFAFLGILLAAFSSSVAVVQGEPASVTFAAPTAQIEAYEFVEISAVVAKPDAGNPFVDATLTGVFSKADGSDPHEVEGFCDSTDGSVFRIRYMPSTSGACSYSLTFKQGTFEAHTSGSFRVTDGHRRGPIRVDTKYPWHFVWEGTGEHYFFNGTTAYFLAGWKDERIIRYTVERLHRLKVNRLRVTIAGREDIFFGEPVMNGDNFSMLQTAWPARHPEDIFQPGFDYTRFYVDYWRRLERAVGFARDCDMTISLVLDMNDSRIHPTAGGADEHRFIHYAVDRLAAYSNVTWDLGDDLDGFRSDDWAHETGTLIEKWDPYKHLASSHPMRDVHQDRSSDWFGFASLQDWNRTQHAYMLNSRSLQVKAGRIVPQANEEYGYEDHYPMWAPPPDQESADVLRRTAWDIYMAGCYQTAGETCRRGTNIWPDTGGGWLNGRGDDTMTMFMGYGHIVDFFSSFEWWKTNPHDELVNNGAYCLANPGETYAIYLPKASTVTVALQEGTYAAHWFGATTGQVVPLPPLHGPTWTSPEKPDNLDWALLLERQR
jgi:hypothetical protein